MHELLATLVYVLYEDAVGNIGSSAPLGTSETATSLEPTPLLSTAASSSPPPLLDMSNKHTKEVEITYIERAVMNRDHIEAVSTWRQAHVPVTYSLSLSLSLSL
jgi:hypothetical protein